MNNGGNWMVGGKRVQFGVQVHARGVDPNPSAGRVRDFDIRMDLSNGNGQRGPSIDDGVFTEQDDLAGRGGGGHVG